MNKLDVSSRVIRWLLLLQEFHLTIVDKPRRHNIVANFVSRLTHTAEKDILDDAFPDEHLFSISAKAP